MPARLILCHHLVTARTARVGGDGLHQFTGFQLRSVAQPWGGSRSPSSLTAGCRHLQGLSARWDAAAAPFPGFHGQFIAASKRVPRAGGRAGDGRCDQLLDRQTQTRFWTPSSSAVYTLTAAWGSGLSRSFPLPLKSGYFLLGISPTEMLAQRYA